jgi:prepilin-type N-terminal cleavage/methylation domain-containing protein
MKSKACAGFSLIEMMIAVAIIGILSSLAIPSFRAVVLRSKTAEASQNLGTMFKSAAAFYTIERGEQGQTGALLAGCTVGDIGPVPANPGAQKQRLTFDPGFRDLGFTVSDYIYYSYGVNSEAGTAACGGAPNDSTVYTLYAQGDLDGDTTLSTFELAVGSDSNNELFHARGMYVADELE